MSSINFDNPYLLFLIIPLVALFAVPFIIAVRKDNINGHNVASGIIHIVMAVIIAFVAAGASVITTVTQTDVYVLADVSYSANRNLDAVDGYISGLRRNLPDNSRLGVICFGRNQQLITRLGDRLSSVKSAKQVDDTATDITGALQFAGQLFRNDVIKRIVLITDGRQTGETDPNELKRTVDELADKKVHVDAIYLDDNIKEDAREVQLSSVSCTQTACLGRSEQAVITINCSCPAKNSDGSAFETEAVLRLSKDGQLFRERTVSLTKGKNQVSFDLDTQTAGTFDYELTMSCEDDENDKNNALSFTQTVSPDFKVLLVAADSVESDLAQLQTIYGASAEIDAPYYRSTTFPCSVEQLCAYDEIVLSDVDLTELNNPEMFMDSLDKVVSLFGKGLVTFGDLSVQIRNGELSALANMLPVIYGANDEDPRAYSIVIDTSYSVDSAGRFANAKTAAKAIIANRSDTDWVSVIEFNGNATAVYPSTQVGDNRDTLNEIIDNLGSKQSTNISSGLQEAQKQLDGNYSEKRIMLISDGVNGISDNTALYKLIDDMLSDGIYTFTLDVGRPNTADSDVARTRLEEMATHGGGECFDISSTDKLLEVLDRDLPQSETVEPSPSHVYVRRSTDEVLKGVDIGRLTNDDTFVSGYVVSTAQSSAITVLTARLAKKGRPGEYDTPPLYSYWSYGNGRVASFTSQMCGSWVSNVPADIREQLIGGVMKTNSPDEKIDTPFLLEILPSDGYYEITLTPSTMRLDATAKIEITSPDGQKVERNMAAGASAFTYTMVTPQVGKYSIKVNYRYGSTEDGEFIGYEFDGERTVNVSYSVEYDSFALYDAGVLIKAIGANGVVSEDGNLKIVNDDKEVGKYNMSLNLPLLIVCVALYAVDVAVRKLKWEDIVSFFKTGKRVK